MNHRLPLVACLPLAGWLSVGLAAQDGSTTVSHGVVFPEAALPADGPLVPPPPRVLGEDATPHDHRKSMPPIPIGTGTLPQPNSPETRGHDAAFPPEAPCDLNFFKYSVVEPAGASTSAIGEPSVAQARDTILQTGNWYAARSIDSGQTWTYVNPYTTFSAVDGGFCCDQRALYIPSHDITVWLLQYSYSGTTQQAGQRIAIANGRDDMQVGSNGSWHSYYMTPSSFGRGLGEWMDFPDIAYSNGFLFCASNIFNSSSVFQDAVVWRMSLTDLAAGGSVAYSYSRSATGLSGGASYRLTQNATTTMYFAEHRSTTSTRAYRWPDATNTISWTDITVPSWTSSYSAIGPNGVNWGGRADSRITGGYSTSGEYGFMWHSGAQGGQTQVFVRTIRISSATNTLTSTQDTWSTTYDFMYPAAAVNASGDIGVTTAIGSNVSTLHPTNFYFIVDSCLPNFHGQSGSWYSGDSSPNSAVWGDYFSVQRHSHSTNTFVATGMKMRGGGNNANSEPQYVWFGRESNAPTYVNLAVSSTPITGVAITVDVTDRNGAKNGNTNFNRVYSPRQGYELTAPATHVSGATTYVFDRWVLLGSLQPVDQRVLTVADIGNLDDTAEARYLARRTLQVRSSNPTSGIAITVSLADLNGAQNGTTAFDRLYKDGVTVGLTAPAANGANPFKQWILNGVNQPLGQTTINVLVDTAVETATAVYYTHVNGSFTAFCSGCPGTAGRIPSHGGSGTPEIGNAISWRITNAAANAGAVMYLGASRTTYNSFPLPLNLGFIGMGPSCLLCVSVDVSIGFATNASGAGGVTVNLPNNTGLISSHVYTQSAIVDFGAGTTIPIVHSNALDTLIGGNF